MEFSYHSLIERLPNSDLKQVLNIWFRLIKINIVIALIVCIVDLLQAALGLTKEKNCRCYGITLTYVWTFGFRVGREK